MSFLKGVLTFIVCVILAVGGAVVGYGMATSWTYKVPQTDKQETKSAISLEATQGLYTLRAEDGDSQNNPITSIINGLTDKTVELSEHAELQRQQLEELITAIDS